MFEENSQIFSGNSATIFIAKDATLYLIHLLVEVYYRYVNENSSTHIFYYLFFVFSRKQNHKLKMSWRSTAQ